MTGHLSEEQIFDLVLGERPDAATAAHLELCDLCRREAGILSAATADFNEIGDRWAQVEAPRSVRPPSAIARRLGVRPALPLTLAGATAACVIALGLGLPLLHSHHAASVASAPSSLQLAQDNQFLASMDQDLRYGPDVISIPASELRPEHTHTRAEDRAPDRHKSLRPVTD